MNDEDWDRVRRHQEREALLASVDHALKEVPQDLVKQLKVEFLVCLDGGGVESVYALSDAIDWHRIPVLYPLVTEHFLHARRPPAALSQRDRSRRARRLSKLAKMLEEVAKATVGIPDCPSWCASLAEAFQPLAIEVARLANEDETSRGPEGPGRPMSAGTRFALGLNGLFWEPEISMTRRCGVIAAVVSAFVEPVTGEQIRQRIKDIHRRPRSS